MGGEKVKHNPGALGIVSFLIHFSLRDEFGGEFVYDLRKIPSGKEPMKMFLKGRPFKGKT